MSAEYTLADTPKVIKRGCWEVPPPPFASDGGTFRPPPTDLTVIFLKLFGYIRTESFIRVLEKTPRAGELLLRE